MTATSSAGDLTLGHIMQVSGLAPDDVLVVRHTYTADGLRLGGTTHDQVIAYAREQGLHFNGHQPPIWLNFLAEGGRRCRY